MPVRSPPAAVLPLFAASHVVPAPHESGSVVIAVVAPARQGGEKDIDTINPAQDQHFAIGKQRGRMGVTCRDERARRRSGIDCRVVQSGAGVNSFTNATPPSDQQFAIAKRRGRVVLTCRGKRARRCPEVGSRVEYFGAGENDTVVPPCDQHIAVG